MISYHQFEVIYRLHTLQNGQKVYTLKTLTIKKLAVVENAVVQYFDVWLINK